MLQLNIDKFIPHCDILIFYKADGYIKNKGHFYGHENKPSF